MQTCALGVVHHLYLQAGEGNGGMSEDLTNGLPCQSAQLSWCPEQSWGKAGTDPARRSLISCWLRLGYHRTFILQSPVSIARVLPESKQGEQGCEPGTSPLLRQVVGGQEGKMLQRWLGTEDPTHCRGIRPSTALKPGSCELCCSRAAPNIWKEEDVSLDSSL